jgi:molecular chaperone IbpA
MLLVGGYGMTEFDFSPLFRSTIGFDRLMRLADTATRVDTGSYPPYNIEATGENAYRLTMAVAGFGPDELDIVVKESDLTVTGKANADEDRSKYLHRGIARRAFERRFQLAEHIKVVGAGLSNGILNVDLVRDVPEAAKPRKVTIVAGAAAQPIEQKQAA